MRVSTLQHLQFSEGTLALGPTPPERTVHAPISQDFHGVWQTNAWHGTKASFKKPGLFFFTLICLLLLFPPLGPFVVHISWSTPATVLYWLLRLMFVSCSSLGNACAFL